MMKATLLSSIFLFLLFGACTHKRLNKDLIEIEKLAEISKDSALKALQKTPPSASNNELNRAYFHLLLIENREIKRSLFAENDSLLDLTLKQFASNDYKELKARALICKGHIWADVNQDEEALKYYYEALNLLDKRSDYKLLPKIYDGLAHIYVNQRLYDQALGMFYKSYQIDSISNDIEKQIRSLCNLSTTQLLLEQPDKSIDCLHQAKKLVQHTQDSLNKAIESLLKYQAGLDSISNMRYKSNAQVLVRKFNIEQAITKVKTESKIRVLTLAGICIAILFTCIILLLLAKKKNLLHEKTILKKEQEITNLQYKIETIRDSVSQINYLDNYTALVQQKKEELFVLLEKDIHYQCSKFKKTTIYKRILELSNQEKTKDAKILTYEEQDELSHCLHTSFSQFMNDLKESFPSLNEADLQICCLSVVGLSPHYISLCLAIVGSSAVKQRKHRIKSKLSESQHGEFMFELIFANKN